MSQRNAAGTGGYDIHEMNGVYYGMEWSCQCLCMNNEHCQWVWEDTI